MVLLGGEETKIKTRSKGSKKFTCTVKGKNLKKCYLGTIFLNFGFVDILNWVILCCYKSCVLWDV